MTNKPPKEYLDGCTLFFNSFGGVSHREVCDQHDKDYWNNRTFFSKIAADIRWFFRIINKHRKENTWYWFIIAFVITFFGLIGLMTFGWIPWVTRHFWDKENGASGITSRIKRILSKKTR